MSKGVVIGTNVAVLVYARTASRAGEIAIRTALGASRRRVVMQLFAEALVLSGLASVVGIVVARFVFRQVDAMLRQSANDQLAASCRETRWEFSARVP